jgi:hypothetical protein
VFTDTAAPYRLEFTSADNGSRGYYAKVFDAAENATTIEALTVTVNIPDTAAPSKPALTLNKTSFLDGEQLVAQVSSVTDDVGVDRVELMLVTSSGSVLLQTDTEAPYELTETVICTTGAEVAPAASRTEEKTVKAVAYDASGNSSESDSQTFTIECAPRFAKR